jgi:hypothetical protein
MEPLDTSNSSSGMPNSQFVYTRSNHNSVLGIGAYAAAAGAELVPVTDEGFALWLSQQQQQQQQQQQPSGTDGPTYSLLAYPAEDNYAGVVYPLSWINRVSAASRLPACPVLAPTQMSACEQAQAAASRTQLTLVLLDACVMLQHMP